MAVLGNKYHILRGRMPTSGREDIQSSERFSLVFQVCPASKWQTRVKARSGCFPRTTLNCWTDLHWQKEVKRQPTQILPPQHTGPGQTLHFIHTETSWTDNSDNVSAAPSPECPPLGKLRVLRCVGRHPTWTSAPALLWKSTADNCFPGEGAMKLNLRACSHSLSGLADTHQWPAGPKPLQHPHPWPLFLWI